MRILIIEDDPATARFYRAALHPEGYAIDVASTAAEGRALARSEPYDGIVLDLGLADGEGVPLLASLRRDGIDVPVLICTGRAGPEHVVQGLDAGADEFVVKPVDVGELRARVRALTRRPRTIHPDRQSVGNVELDRASHVVRVGGATLELTAREYSLLDHFLRHIGVVVTRTELLEKLWDRHTDPDSKVVDVHVSKLRRKLSGAGATLDIATVRGVGFRADVGESPTDPSRGAADASRAGVRRADDSTAG